MDKKIGQFIIVMDYENIFDDNMIGIIYKGDRNNLYGWIYTDHVELYRPEKFTWENIHINDRNMDRIGFIHLYGNDTRLNGLWNYIHEYTRRVIDYEKNLMYDETDRWILLRKEDRL